jgi:hypothetical protein
MTASMAAFFTFSSFIISCSGRVYSVRVAVTEDAERLLEDATEAAA